MDISGLVTSEQLIKVRSIINTGTDWVRLYERANGIIGNISKLPGHKTESLSNTLLALSGYDWLGSPSYAPSSVVTVTSNVDLIPETAVYENLQLQMADGSWVGNNIDEAVVIDSRTIRVSSNSVTFPIFGLRWTNPTSTFMGVVANPAVVRFPDTLEILAGDFWAIYIEEIYMSADQQLFISFFNDPYTVGFSETVTAQDFAGLQIMDEAGVWRSAGSIISGGQAGQSSVTLGMAGSYNNQQSYDSFRITDLSPVTFTLNGSGSYGFRYPRYGSYSLSF